MGVAKWDHIQALGRLPRIAAMRSPSRSAAHTITAAARAAISSRVHAIAQPSFLRTVRCSMRFSGVVNPADVKAGNAGRVPMHLRDAHYGGAAAHGHGKGYVYPHDVPHAVAPQQYLPDTLRDAQYYRPTEYGAERTVKRRLGILRDILRGRRAGIFGMGRIGQAVARRARAFGLQIHYHNRRPVAPMIADELGATYWESLDQMLARMDIISVNCPHTPATYHLLSARRLKLIRKEAYIVNTARGEVIDEDTLIKLIEAGDVGGAGLDVYEHEPAVNPKLVRLARAGKVTLLPHMGSATIEGRVEMGEKVIINIRTFLDAHKPPDRVLPSML